MHPTNQGVVPASPLLYFALLTRRIIYTLSRQNTGLDRVTDIMAIPRVQFPTSLAADGSDAVGADGAGAFDPIANSTDEDLMTIFVAELYIAAKKIAPHKAKAGQVSPSSAGGGGGGGGGGMVGMVGGSQIELEPEGDEGGFPPHRPRPATSSSPRSPRRGANNGGDCHTITTC